ncbi:glycosyltransferase [bacterium]|nr:glycosyltransferase [bacterium]
MKTLKKYTSKFLNRIKNTINNYTVIKQFVYSCLRRKKYFFIITYVHNAENTIENCLQSVYEQDYNCYNHFIINDASDDFTAEIIEKWIKNHHNHKVVYRLNDTKKGYGQCCVDYFAYAIASAIIIELNHKIRIKEKDYLSCLNKVYFDRDVLMTYTMFKYKQVHKTHLLQKFESAILDKKLFRDSMWVTEYLYSFRKKLFCFIKEESLIDQQTGKYHDKFWRLSYILPLLEIAADRLRYIDKNIYLDEKEDYFRKIDTKHTEYKQIINNIPKHSPINNLDKSDIGYICGHHPYADRFIYGLMSNFGLNMRLLQKYRENF